jgi:methylenetetrahydrofolate dehydrogenase (NADP+)/methenyltetrahydrofolate cyclohydrolase
MFSKFDLLRIGRRFFASTPSTLVLKRPKAVTIDGNKIASQIIGVTVRDDIDRLVKVGVTPKLVAIVVGDVPESKIYVERKKLAAAKFGIDCQVHNLPSSTSQETLVILNTYISVNNAYYVIYISVFL